MASVFVECFYEYHVSIFNNYERYEFLACLWLHKAFKSKLTVKNVKMSLIIHVAWKFLSGPLNFAQQTIDLF